MRFKEALQMKQEERDEKLRELQLELIKLNAQVATGTPPKNAGQLRRLKKDIARIMLLRGGGERKPASKRAETLTKSSAKKEIKDKKTSKKQNE